MFQYQRAMQAMHLAAPAMVPRSLWTPARRVAYTAAAGTGAFQPQAAARRVRKMPNFEIHDVRDDPALGKMTRVAIDGKVLLLSQYPQLGARKVDPNDVTSQFDRDRRISVRMRHVDLSGFVCVCQGKLPEYSITSPSFNLHFTKSEDGRGYLLKGEVQRVASQKREDWSISFEKEYAVTLEHFLDSSLSDSFGFNEFYNRPQVPQAAQDRVSPQGQQGARRGQSYSRQDGNQTRRRQDRQRDGQQE